MAHDAFISYSKKDKEIADAICKALENDGLTCWYAPRDVDIGADWDASIMEALADSRVMILVWSPHSDTSRQVKRELAIALDDIGVSLIPFRTEIIEPSKLRYYLGNIQWLDASTAPLENSLQLLILEVRTAIARINPTESARQQPRATEEATAKTEEVTSVEPASEDAGLQAEELDELLEKKRAEEEEGQRVEEEQRKADEAERQRAEAEARLLAEAEIRRAELEARRRAEEAARERAAKEARIRAAEETERLAREKQASERERQRLAAEQAKAAEIERQRAEAAARRRQDAEERKWEEAQVHHRADAREREELVTSQRLQPEARKQASVGSVSLLDSYGSIPNQRFPLQAVIISVVAVLIAVAGLAYAFWPAKHEDQNQLSTEGIASNQTPTPEMPTPLPSPSIESNSGSSPAKPSPAKPSPTPRKVPTPERSPTESATKPSPTPPRQPISLGVLNGKAISLPKPAYPPIASQAHASGTVVVQVTIDENGNVMSARAVSGHPLLQGVAVAAARGARFSPTRLSGQPVKVTGVVTYNFVAQ